MTSREREEDMETQRNKGEHGQREETETEIRRGKDRNRETGR